MICQSTVVFVKGGKCRQHSKLGLDSDSAPLKADAQIFYIIIIIFIENKINIVYIVHKGEANIATPNIISTTKKRNIMMMQSLERKIN
jgi:hypothetical protein